MFLERETEEMIRQLFLVLFSGEYVRSLQACKTPPTIRKTLLKRISSYYPNFYLIPTA